MLIVGESTTKIFVIFLQFHLVNRLLCTMSIYCNDEHKTDNKMNKIRSPTEADNRFIVVTPAERTKHHLTPYLMKLISVCLCSVLQYQPDDDDIEAHKAPGKTRDAHGHMHTAEEKSNYVKYSL